MKKHKVEYKILGTDVLKKLGIPFSKEHEEIENFHYSSYKKVLYITISEK